jgi:hypothetical protein
VRNSKPSRASSSPSLLSSFVSSAICPPEVEV